MDNGNICKFVSLPQSMSAEIQTVNFVLENTDVGAVESIRSVYAMHLVTRGDGELLYDGKRYEIVKGDVFFTMPASRYAIYGKNDFEYAYISFLGAGAVTLMRRVMPEPKWKIFGGNERFIPLWKQAVAHARAENTDLVAKGILEYSAALLITRLPNERPPDIAAEIENYVRKNFTSSELRLQSIAKLYGYNEKYLSKLFYRKTGPHFGEYLADLRINAACGLMQEGKVSVKEVAFACGFSDPLYFSKVFKKRMLVSPSAFAENK